MATASPRADRWTAAVLLLMAAILPAGMLYLYLFSSESVGWRHALDVAMAPDSGAREQFILLGIGAALSAIAAATISLARHRLVLRTLFFSASALTLCYALTGMWLLVLVSALPLWWAYKVTA